MLKLLSSQPSWSEFFPILCCFFEGSAGQSQKPQALDSWLWQGGAGAGGPEVHSDPGWGGVAPGPQTFLATPCVLDPTAAAPPSEPQRVKWERVVIRTLAQLQMRKIVMSERRPRGCVSFPNPTPRRPGLLSLLRQIRFSQLKSCFLCTPIRPSFSLNIMTQERGCTFK